MQNIFKLHAMLKSIVSYSNKIFTSKFLQHLLKLPDTFLLMSSTYYPQSDNQTEVLKKCLKIYSMYLTFLESKKLVQSISLGRILV